MVDIPPRYHCNTGDEAPAYELIEKFFADVIEEIGTPSDRPSPYRIEVCNYERGDGATHILLCDDKPAATVLETRDTMNWVNFTFFTNLEGLVE